MEDRVGHRRATANIDAAEAQIQNPMMELETFIDLSLSLA
jgi:hypothetical protein